MNRSPRPEPPREAPLIEAARKQKRLTVREAAKQARVSEAGWRQIVSGAESLGGGTYREVKAKAETLARIAQVVGITSDQLARVGREDAAAALEEITPEPEPTPSYSPPVDAVYAIMAALPPDAQAEVIRRLGHMGLAARPEEGGTEHQHRRTG
ncbi:helix-turn-helix domain-containing protein [Streptomyces sp. NPDC056831]|uniref:helix-turn-helix domain-containing protein n=1 Tax=Streptomyces sp. NPDC056831 TaxID=3345954 RepID=UPI0036975EAA